MSSKNLSGEGSSDTQQLENMRTLGEILEIAMAFEHTARDFYRSLEAGVSKPLRALVKELADEEQHHYQLFKDLKERDDVHEVVGMRLEAPASDHRFSNYAQAPDLGDSPDEQTIVQYAMGREQAAMEQYASLAEKVPAGVVQDLFKYLAEEELAHKAELEKRYYALVYTTNV